MHLTDIVLSLFSLAVAELRSWKFFHRAFKCPIDSFECQCLELRL